jgi:predicted ATPase
VAYGLGVLVSRVAAAEPLVLVVENAHLLDGQSVDVLAELAQAGVGRRMLVLLVGQPSTLAGRRIADTVESLDVGELPDEVLREMIVERLGAGEEMEAIAEQILPRAQGNPFFLGEIVDSLIDRGIIAPVELAGSEVRYRQAKPGAIRLPTTMEGLAGEHIDALDPPLRTTLRAAAAVGTDFTLQIVSGLVGRDVSGDLRALKEQGLIDESAVDPRGNASYRFKRPMVREAAYRGISGSDRQRIHRLLAEQLIADVEAGDVVPAVSIAWQLDRAGEIEQAGDYYVEAGDAAMRVYSNRQALKLYDRAIPLFSELSAERFDALARREKVLRALGRQRERGADIEQMERIAGELEDRVRLALSALRRAQLEYDQGDFTEAAQFLGRVLDVGVEADDRFLQVEALRLLAYVATEEGHLIRALDTCERALAVVPEGGEGTYLRGRILGVKGFVMLVLGYLGTAPEVLAEALVLFRLLGKRRNESSPWWPRPGASSPRQCTSCRPRCASTGRSARSAPRDASWRRWGRFDWSSAI